MVYVSRADRGRGYSSAGDAEWKDRFRSGRLDAAYMLMVNASRSKESLSRDKKDKWGFRS